MSKQDRSHRVPTADDVAALAGVSRSAVSRTFTEGASVAPATRDKVIDAARSLGYRVNFLARSLSRQRTNLIGLVVSELDNPFRAAMMDQIARRLIEEHYRPFVLPTGAGGDTRHLIDMMMHYNVCGAIVTGDASPAEIAEECAAYHVPLTLINKPEIGPHADNVSMDAKKAGRLAAETLREIGCRTVAIASQRRPSHTIEQRLVSFAGRCAELGLEIVGTFQGAVQDYDGGREAAIAYLEAGRIAEGMFCANDYMALGLLDHLRRFAKLRVPEDLKVIACDDIAESAWLSYDLTTIRQDPADLAAAAVRSLLARIETPASTRSAAIIDVQLMLRGSTGHPSQIFGK
ncbi:LacI family DNA-binding transcriptional regulator [Rhizobium halophytocola]|uniref:DNA-binding LacI/PurR family transcriptional regulator n=1 Tax=Rhizobium halophytocola TaxID=735519 RepID=A0ABS4DTX9_9HYPH|nr:LacI family DNA-binding transcriptional regulator [Rhizobium halophytocola]MBP1849145.1 DNA-binding LacI/PurR family transcriptional regulator [Rhizobium halophytocola]